MCVVSRLKFQLCISYRVQMAFGFCPSHVAVISSYRPHGQIMSAIYITSNTFLLYTFYCPCLRKILRLSPPLETVTWELFITEMLSQTGNKESLNPNPCTCFVGFQGTVSQSLLIGICHSSYYWTVV
jgi:hypothetical protein